MAEKLFLKILSSALKGKQITLNETVSEEVWKQVFELSRYHRVLPLVYDTVYANFPNTDSTIAIKELSKKLLTEQALKTHEFSQLYKALSQKCLSPVVVKGIVCRSVYPKPDLRISSDEDLLIPQKKYVDYESFLESKGFSLLRTINTRDYERSFINKNGLKLDLHTRLFPDEPMFYTWENCFKDVFEKTEIFNAEDAHLMTLNPTDHLMYLILHAAKHFIHGGVGIRQVCDVVMYSNYYSDTIDWKLIYEKSRKCSVHKFTKALFLIGENHLDIKISNPVFINTWQGISVDENELLSDIMSAGVYGNENPERARSGNMTLSAVQGKKNGLMVSIFPSCDLLKSRFPYAQKCPLLLPVAWTHRIFRYLFRSEKASGDLEQKSAYTIGKERSALIRKYEILLK